MPMALRTPLGEFMSNHMICTAHEGVSWIVCWTIRSEAIGYVDTDYYEAFESLAEAKQRYDIIKYKDSLYIHSRRLIFDNLC